jgi:putative ABC transport system permease protein
MINLNASPRLGILLDLSFRDLWHDRMVSLCLIASVLAVVAPLLLLFGWKFGIVSQMRQDLMADPRNKEIKMIASASLDRAWFARVGSMPGVGFVLPLTRSLNALADLHKDSSHFVDNVELIPTAKSDPLLGNRRELQSATGVILSASAARQLEVAAGDSITLRVLRSLNNKTERAQMSVKVEQVLAPESFSRPAALIDLTLLVALEDFRDGFKVPLLQITNGDEPRERERFARARIYADHIESVEALANRLTDEGIQNSSRLADIKTVQSIDQVLGVVFSVIAWTAVLGCAASMMGGLMANIDRKRKDLALLRLFGFGKNVLPLYVVNQALVLTLLGFALGCCIYALGSHLFNQLLGAFLAADRFVCRLEPIHFLVALGCAMLIAALVSGIGSLTVMQIEPAESLRDV